jgi:hypothetical protein
MPASYSPSLFWFVNVADPDWSWKEGQGVVQNLCAVLLVLVRSFSGPSFVGMTR